MQDWNLQHNEFIMPKDEGWWTSILADEDAQTRESTGINCASCSTQSADGMDWDCIKRVFQQDEVVLLQVHGCNRGGLLVKGEGIQGFVPVSHLVDFPVDIGDELRQAKLAEYVDKSLYLKVIECEPENDRVVLSERAAQAGDGKRKQLFEALTPGVIACGVVTNITDFGAFVDLGGVEGLIHVSELSWGRVEHPSELLKIGQQVKVTVLQLNETTSRIALSMKRLAPNPWERLLENHRPGDVVTAEVTSIMKFGVFARLEQGIEGLIHISSFPSDLDRDQLAETYVPGQFIQVRILHVDPDRRRLGLGLVLTE